MINYALRLWQSEVEKHNSKTSKEVYVVRAYREIKSQKKKLKTLYFV